MAGPKTVAFRGVQDCKIAQLTLDTTASKTYSTLYDVPIQNLSFTTNMDTFTLKHDDLVQEIDQQTQSYEVKGTMARVPLDVLAILQGGTVTASGSGDAEVQTYVHSYSDKPNYFKLEMQSTRAFAIDGAAGDVHIRFPKCKVTALDYKIENDFATIDFTATTIRTINDGILKEIIVNETQTAIA